MVAEPRHRLHRNGDAGLVCPHPASIHTRDAGHELVLQARDSHGRGDGVGGDGFAGRGGTVACAGTPVRHGTEPAGGRTFHATAHGGIGGGWTACRSHSPSGWTAAGRNGISGACHDQHRWVGVQRFQQCRLRRGRSDGGSWPCIGRWADGFFGGHHEQRAGGESGLGWRHEATSYDTAPDWGSPGSGW